MRDYGKIAPSFWTGDTGKALRGDPVAQTMAAYVMTCPSANMIGLYYVPLTTISFETGIPIDGALEALRRCAVVGLAHYDENTSTMWVPKMAEYQIAPSMKATDKRGKGVLRELSAFRKHPFARLFFDRYGEVYQLETPDWLSVPFEAPSKPHRSQDQDQEQKQEQEGHAPAAPPPPKLEPLLRERANRTDDGCFGDAVAAWEKGVSVGTGIEQAKLTSPADIAKLIAVFRARCPELSKRIEWAGAAGEAWGRVAQVVNVLRFVDWANSPTRQAPAPAKVIGQPEVRSPARRPIEPLRPARQNG